MTLESKSPPSSHDVLQAERDRLRLLLDITNLLVSRHDLTDLLEALSECMGRAVPHEYASISLFEESNAPGRRLRVWLTVLDGERRRDLENQTFDITAETMATLDADGAITVDLDRIRLRNRDLAESLGSQGLLSFCSVQLTSVRGPFGILSVASRKPDGFRSEEMGLLRESSGQLSIALDNSLAYDEIRRLKDQLVSEKEYLEEEIRDEHGFREIIGRSAALRLALQQVDTVASTDATVLLLGETGTGKELVARAIHERSVRSGQNFVRVNCAAIPPALIESEMFGHERGAFTGAVSARLGRFEVAHRGSLFLDEIGELPLDMQPKLLRAVQEREIQRVGGSVPIGVDLRLIAATNRDLAPMVQSGLFREDLYYRLNVFPIRLPSLRERREDIPTLVGHFVRKHAARLKRTIGGIPTPTMEALSSWDWPGNVRELENVIERAVILATDGVLRVPLSGAAGSAPPKGASTLGALDAAQRETILNALRTARGVLGGPAGAAAQLGIKRTTLQSRMRKLGIGRPSY